MNHIQILKRSWKILWSYKTLWLFGILVAFTTMEATSSPNARGNLSPENVQWRELSPQQLEDLPEGLREAISELQQEFPKTIPTETVNNIIGIIIAVFCVLLLVAVAMTVVQYISRTALIRMVDRYEESGEKVDWRSGFRLGWSRSALWLFLIDLLIFLVLFVGVIALFAFAAGPVLLSAILGGLAPLVGVVMTIGLGMLAIFTVFIVAALVSMAREIFYRECILRGRGVFDSIRCGIATLRANIKDIFLLWLLLLVIRIAIIVAMIPIVFLLLAVGLVIGAIVGGTLYLALQAAAQTTAVFVALVAGLIALGLVVGIPTLFLRGLRVTYLSSAWTLGYREIPAEASEGNSTK